MLIIFWFLCSRKQIKSFKLVNVGLWTKQDTRHHHQFQVWGKTDQHHCWKTPQMSRDVPTPQLTSNSRIFQDKSPQIQGQNVQGKRTGGQRETVGGVITNTGDIYLNIN